MNLLSLTQKDIEQATERFEHLNASEVPPVLSVIVSCFNHGAFIEACLLSIYGQEFEEPFEVIIGDDGSRDDSFDRCLNIARQHPIETKIFQWREDSKWLRQGRPTGKLNFIRCYHLARGEFIAITDGDDQWINPMKLSLQIARMREGGYVISAAQSLKGKDVGTAEVSDKRCPPGEYSFDDVRRNNHTGDATNTLVIRDDDRPQTVSYLLNQFLSSPYLDWPLQCILLKNGKKGIVLEDVLGFYRQHAGGLNTSKSPLARVLDRYLMLELFAAHFGEDHTNVGETMEHDIHQASFESLDRDGFDGLIQLKKNGVTGIPKLLFKSALVLAKLIFSETTKSLLHKKRP